MDLINIELQLTDMGDSDRLAIEAKYGKILHDMVLLRKPKVIVEVGTGHGYSTTWMMMALEKNQSGKLYTIDIEKYKNPVWEKMNLPPFRMTQMIGELDEKIQDVPQFIDMAFLDSDHMIDKITRDIDILWPKLCTNARVAIHDVKYCDNMGKLLKDYFAGENKQGLEHCSVIPRPERKWMYQEDLSSWCGLGIATKLGGKK